MRDQISILPLVLALSCSLALPQSTEPDVFKATLSVHEVRRGNMPQRQNFSGSITSLKPPTVSVTLPPSAADAVRVGQKASLQIRPPTIFTGRVIRVGSATAEIELAESLPTDATLGTKLGAMIEVGELSDIVFFDRPADARPNTETSVFVLESDGQHARRVNVRYGSISGPQIQILSGLSPGDRVIVTDMSKWASYPRVTLK
jgi:multidrug efflux pump subunit AcrA (membrane-fusion protein)